MNEVLKMHSHLGSQGWKLCDQSETKSLLGESMPYGFCGLYKLTGWYAALILGKFGLSLVHVDGKAEGSTTT